MVIPEDVRLEWYEALSREDSLNVMALLKGHPELLEVGWGSEVLESPGQDQERKKRTALHVGVKRGNVKLVEEVLLLCNGEAVVDKRLKMMKDLDGGDPLSRNSRDLIDLAEIDEAHKNEEVTAGLSQKDTTSEGDRQPTGTRLQKAVLGSDPEPAQKSISSNSSPEKERLQRSLSTDDGRATEKISSTGGLRKIPSRINLVANPNDNTFLRRLLMFKDGEYSLDAIAIAALHGNREIFRLLLQAMGKNKFYDVYMSGPPPLDINRDNEENRQNRTKLRKATEKVVLDWTDTSKLGEFSSKRLVVLRCLAEYEKHLDFNFLPWQEYLFHFLFTRGGFLQVRGFRLAQVLWQAVSSCSAPTWRFLLELQDGQGRTPLHVAVDEDRVPGFEKCIFSYCTCEREVAECATAAQDGVGRTPLHTPGMVTGAWDASKWGSLEMKSVPLAGAWDASKSGSGEMKLVPQLVDEDGVPGFEQCSSDNCKRKKEVAECAMAAQDGAGRTALQRGMATGAWDASKSGSGEMKLVPLVHGIWQHSIPIIYHTWTQCKFPVDMLSSENGFKGLGTLGPVNMLSSESDFKDVSTLGKEAIIIRNIQSNPLCTAILHRQAAAVRNRMDCAMKGLPMVDTFVMKLSQQQQLRRLRSQIGETLWLDHVVPYSLEQEKTLRSGLLLPCSGEQGDRGRWEMNLDAVEFATLVGDVSILELLPLAGYNTSKNSGLRRTKKHRPWPALHIAANAGNYEVLRLFLDDPFCDPNEVDWEGNNALHHALNVITIGEFQPHLLDYVNCEHIQSRDREKKEKKRIAGVVPVSAGSAPIIDREECINLLLEVGCDIFKMNHHGQPPYPKGKLSKTSVFRSWWYKKRREELEAIQTTLRSAANAIALTATLVATASYVGPLTPPMGLAGDPSQIQDAYLWVGVFIFCDTMSFYCAIVAIILSLIPLLPMVEQDMKDEVWRTRGMVTMSLIALFPSVIFVLVAFISSSIAVVSADVKSTGGSLPIAAASIGGLFCLVTLIGFFVRQLLAAMFPRQKWVRRFHKIIDKFIVFG